MMQTAFEFRVGPGNVDRQSFLRKHLRKGETTEATAYAPQELSS
jgi:hypothetical protein